MTVAVAVVAAVVVTLAAAVAKQCVCVWCMCVTYHALCELEWFKLCVCCSYKVSESHYA
jgi:hypothetical protein